MHMLLGGREWGTREGLVFKASEASRPGLQFGMFSMPPFIRWNIEQGSPGAGERGWKPSVLGTCWGRHMREGVGLCAESLKS